jgi:hypothetical protein
VVEINDCQPEYFAEPAGDGGSGNVYRDINGRMVIIGHSSPVRPEEERAMNGRGGGDPGNCGAKGSYAEYGDDNAPW